ncbi:MAG: manganese efflux pump [Bacilli bacterium]|nr:manganese efflux pump [Bacilli bacterium]
MNIFSIILIAISLSLDAFSLAFSYGLMNLNIKKILFVSFIVGIFHFFMPLLGLYIGEYITKTLNINPKLIMFIMFLIVIIEMIKSINEEVEQKKLNVIGSLVFALLVSLDSFSLGIGLYFITKNLFLAALIFSISSFLFTLAGFFLGKYVSLKMEKSSKIIGIIIMFTMLLYYLCK